MKSAWVVWAGSIVLLAGIGCEREREASPEPAPAPPPASVAAEPTPAATVSAAPPAPSATALAEPPAVESAPPAKARAAATAQKPDVKPSASASAPARKVSTAVGSGASGEGFSLSIQAPTPVKSGQASSAVVSLRAVEPYHCNEKYPYKLVLDAPSGGVSYPQQTVRGMAVAEKQSSLSVPFSATQPGPATIAGLMHFSICTADKCLIEKRRVSVTIQVD